MFLRNYLINYEVKNYSHQKFIKEKHRGVNHRFTPLCVSTRSGTRTRTAAMAKGF